MMELCKSSPLATASQLGRKGEEKRDEVEVEVATHDGIMGLEGSKQILEIWAILTRTAADGRRINVDNEQRGLREVDGDALNFHNLIVRQETRATERLPRSRKSQNSARQIPMLSAFKFKRPPGTGVRRLRGELGGGDDERVPRGNRGAGGESGSRLPLSEVGLFGQAQVPELESDRQEIEAIPGRGPEDSWGRSSQETNWMPWRTWSTFYVPTGEVPPESAAAESLSLGLAEERRQESNYPHDRGRRSWCVGSLDRYRKKTK